MTENTNQMDPDVILKPIDESDLEFWKNLIDQPESREHQPVKVRTLDELRKQLERYSEPNLAHPLHRAYKWVVIDKKTGDKVGAISFDKLNLEQRIGRIGYTISKKFWGRGYGTAAVSTLTEKIFAESKIERIEAECSVYNPASRRVLEKSGYRLEGTKRGYLEIHGVRVDHWSFGLLRSDWEKSN